MRKAPPLDFLSSDARARRTDDSAIAYPRLTRPEESPLSTPRRRVPINRAIESLTLLVALGGIGACAGGKSDGATAPTLPNKDFSLQVSTASPAQAGGTPSGFTVSSSAIGGFGSPIAITLLGTPAGTTTAPALPLELPPGGTQTISLTVPRTAEVKTWAVTLRGTSGTLSHDVAVLIAVTAAADFDVAFTPAAVSLRPGTSVLTRVSVSSRNGFADSVAVALPAGAAGLSFSPATVRLGVGQFATVTVAASNQASINTAALKATASASSITKDVPLTVAVVPNTWYHRVGSTLLIDRINGTDSIRVASEASLSSGYPTANLSARKKLPASLRNNPIEYPSHRILKRGHFQKDISDETLALYESYWEKLKMGE